MRFISQKSTEISKYNKEEKKYAKIVNNKEIVLTDKLTKFGRESQSSSEDFMDIILSTKAKAISSKHCVIGYEDNGWYI